VQAAPVRARARLGAELARVELARVELAQPAAAPEARALEGRVETVRELEQARAPGTAAPRRDGALEPLEQGPVQARQAVEPEPLGDRVRAARVRRVRAAVQARPDVARVRGPRAGREPERVRLPEAVAPQKQARRVQVEPPKQGAAREAAPRPEPRRRVARGQQAQGQQVARARQAVALKPDALGRV